MARRRQGRRTSEDPQNTETTEVEVQETVEQIEPLEESQQVEAPEPVAEEAAQEDDAGQEDEVAVARLSELEEATKDVEQRAHVRLAEMGREFEINLEDRVEYASAVAHGFFQRLVAAEERLERLEARLAEIEGGVSVPEPEQAPLPPSAAGGRFSRSERSAEPVEEPRTPSGPVTPQGPPPPEPPAGARAVAARMAEAGYSQKEVDHFLRYAFDLE
jgi:hypothetical protein